MVRQSKNHTRDPTSSRAADLATENSQIAEEHDFVLELPVEQFSLTKLDLQQRLLNMESLLHDVVHEITSFNLELLN